MTPERIHSRAFTAVGIAVVLLGVIHTVSVFVVYPHELHAFAASGFGGLSDATGDEVASFWSFLFGVLVAAAGQQIWWAGRRHHIISIVPGCFLLAVGLVGGWYVPFAPFWAAAVLGAVVIGLVVSRRRRRSSGRTNTAVRQVS